MNASGKSRLEKGLKAGAALVFFAVGSLGGASLLMAVVWGVIGVVVGFLAVDLANTVAGVGWLAIARLSGCEVRIWFIGSWFRQRGGDIRTRRKSTFPMIGIDRDTMLPSTSGERLGVMGGVIASAVWLLITLAIVPVLFIFDPPRFWLGLMAALGAVYTLILMCEYRAEPHGSPMWLYYQSLSDSPLATGCRAIDRLEELRQETGRIGDLPEAEAMMMLEVREPWTWRVIAWRAYISWLEDRDRMAEARNEIDAYVALVEPSREAVPRSAYSLHLTDVALFYAMRGEFEIAERLNAQIERTDLCAMAWHGLQALLLRERGFRVDAEEEFKKSVALMKEKPLKSEEAQAARFEKARKEFPMFADLVV